MSIDRKLKRNFSDSEDEDFFLQIPAKKKRICLDSGSENESNCLDKSILKNGEKSEATSHGDEPLENKIENSKVDTSGSISDDKPLAVKDKCSSIYSDGSEISSISSDGISQEDAYDDDDDEPISNIAKRKASKLKDKSKVMKHSSDSSEDEPLANKGKKSSQNSNTQSITEELRSESDDEPLATFNKRKISRKAASTKLEIKHSSDSSEDEPLAKKSRKFSASSNNQSITEGLHSESEDEYIATSNKGKIRQMATSEKLKAHDTSSCNSSEPVESSNFPEHLKTNNMAEELDSEIDKTKSEVSSDEVSLNEIIKLSKTSGKSKADSLASDSEEEFLIIKNKSSKKKPNERKNKNQSISNGDKTSSDEDEPIGKIARTSKDTGNMQNKHYSSSSSDDEPLATKMTANKKRKSQESSDLSSDDEEKPLSSISKQKVNKKKVSKGKTPPNGKIEHLKKYLRVAGIHVQSYDKLFENCKSIKSKIEKLLGLLHEKGLKGRPTIEKCKKLKKKIETKKEIAELDISNIIKSEGRPKRGSSGKIEKTINTENSPAGKKFMRLRDIIDSEESD